MRAVVDIIGLVITAMKPLYTGLTVVANSASPYLITGFTTTLGLYVGQKVKVIGANPVVTAYCEITAVTATSVTVSTVSTLTVGHANNTLSTLQPVLNYHYGHLQEIRNTFKIATQSTLKKEQFPAIILVQDFQETVLDRDYQREANLRLFILTDSKQSFTASDRYTYTFKPILYEIETRLFSALEDNKYIHGFEGYTRYDRLYWGRTGNEDGTATNIFNDFIDAIEIENLKITIANC